MKEYKIIFIVLLIVLIALIVFMFTNKTASQDETKENTDIEISEKDKEKVIDEITSDINEETESNTENNETGKEYDQYLVASGYSGASDNVYYIKDGVLYHLVISTKEITKVAEGVKKIESAKGSIQVYKDNNFKIFTEDNYLTYME